MSNAEPDRDGRNESSSLGASPADLGAPPAESSGARPPAQVVFPWVAKSRRRKVTLASGPATGPAEAAASGDHGHTLGSDDDFALPRTRSAGRFDAVARETALRWRYETERAFEADVLAKESGAAPGAPDDPQLDASVSAPTDDAAIALARRLAARGAEDAAISAPARGLRARRFSLLVIGETVATQLTPFRSVRRPAAEAAPDGDDRAQGPEWRDLTAEVKAAHLEHRRFGGDIATLREFAVAKGHEARIGPDGELLIGFWVSRGGKWERWSIGGAFRDRLRVSWRREPLDQARFGDLDFAAMREAIRRDAEGRHQRARRDPGLADDLGVDLTLSAAENVMRRLRRHPLICAALLRDGAWCEMPGDVTQATFDDAWSRMFDELIADLKTTDLVTIVDCQI